MCVLLAAWVFSSVSMLSYGAIYKCVDAKGRVLIGDQPCVVHDAAAASARDSRVKESLAVVAAPPLAIKEPSQPERVQALLERESLEQKIQLKHNTECRDLRIQLKKQGHFASNPLLLEPSVNKDDKLKEVQYQQKCLTQAKDIVILDQAQKERVSADKVRQAACEIKVREYEKRKQQLNGASSDLDVTIFEVLHAEVKRGCR
jgi:hypothetical protein